MKTLGWPQDPPASYTTWYPHLGALLDWAEMFLNAGFTDEEGDNNSSNGEDDKE